MTSRIGRRGHNLRVGLLFVRKGAQQGVDHTPLRASKTVEPKDSGLTPAAPRTATSGFYENLMGHEKSGLHLGQPLRLASGGPQPGPLVLD